MEIYVDANTREEAVCKLRNFLIFQYGWFHKLTMIKNLTKKFDGWYCTVRLTNIEKLISEGGNKK